MCRSCRGAKQLLGMGGIKYEKCHGCKGAGVVEDVEEKEEDELLSMTAEDIAELEGEVEEAPAAVITAKVIEPVVAQKPKYVRPSRAKKK
jgi:hypothetical protein